MDANCLLRYVLGLILAICFAQSATGQLPEPLPQMALPSQPEPLPPVGAPPGLPGITLAQLEQIALASNPTLVQAAMRVQAAEGNNVQVGLYPNPVVGYRSDEIGNQNTAGFQGAVFSQEYVTAGKLRLNRDMATAEITQAQWALETQRLRVVNDVRSAFYDALAAKRTVDLYEQLVHVGDEGLKATEQMLAGKEVSRVDVLQARVEVRSVALQLQTTRNQQLEIWRRLSALAGTPNMALTQPAGNLEDDLPILTWETAQARLLTGSPELAEAQAGVTRSQRALDRQRAERVPNLQLQSGVFHDFENGFNVASAGVGLALPIFNRNQGNIRKSEAELTAARQQVDRTQFDLQQRLATAFQQYDSARERVEKYGKEILPDARESLELVRKGYGAGEFNYLVLLTAQRTYFQVSLNYIESLRALRQSTVAIEGMLLSGGLNAGAGPATSGVPAAAGATSAGGG